MWKVADSPLSEGLHPAIRMAIVPSVGNEGAAGGTLAGCWSEFFVGAGGVRYIVRVCLGPIRLIPCRVPPFVGQKSSLHSVLPGQIRER